MCREDKKVDHNSLDLIFVYLIFLQYTFFFYRGRDIPKSGRNVLYFFAKNRAGRPLFYKKTSSIFLNYQTSRIHVMHLGTNDWQFSMN